MAEIRTRIWDFLWAFFSGTGLTIVKAIAILFVGILFILVLKKAVKKNATKSRKIDNAASSFLTSIVSLVAYVLLVVVLVGSFGFSTTGIITALSSVMLAVALGLQDTLASLANGILLIFTKPFQAGDFVDISGTSGTVKEVKLFSVKLTTTDNLTVIIPNNTVFTSTIVNYSKMPLRRIELTIPVSYTTDVEKLKQAVNGLVERDNRIRKDPAPFFRLTEYGASSLNFKLRVWTKSAEYWAVRFDLTENLLEALRASDITIPYDQLDVHIVDAPSVGKEA